MTFTDRPQSTLSCGECDAAIELCAFCDQEECRDPLCYRCVRIVLGQEISQPHGHGG